MQNPNALAASTLKAADAAALGQPWQPLGPMQISTVAYGKVTGRVSSIAADPSDGSGNTVFLGTTGGGVWKSTNAAAAPAAVSFVPLTDDLGAFSQGNLASLSIGAITVQPGGTGVILAGTGDQNDALDSYYGSGLLRSTDGGLTWSLIRKSADASVNLISDFYFTGDAIAGFAWSSIDSSLVVAAVSDSAEGSLVDADLIDSQGDVTRSVKGIYYSLDAGVTWHLATITDGANKVVQTGLIPPAGGGNAATAIAWNAVRKRFYAAVRYHGYYESTDGITWMRLASQPGTGLTSTACPTHPNSVGSAGCPIYRGALAAQSSTGDLFAITVDSGNVDQGLWQDVCSAVSGACASNTISFAHQLSAAALEDGSGVISAGDYSLWLAAVPAASDTLLFAGTTDIFRCGLAGGCAWRNTTNTTTCAAADVAPLQHAVDATFAATLSLLYFGNDSGLWRSTDNVSQTQPACDPDDANHFQNLNGGLGSLAEVTAFAQDSANSAILLAGLGINGTAAASTAAQAVWPQVIDGYGSYAAIDPASSQNWYAESSGGVSVEQCSNGSLCNPGSFSPAVGSGQMGTEANAILLPAPFILDPQLDSQGDTNLILGTCHVWRGPANGVSWSPANQLGELYSGEGPDCTNHAQVQSLAVTGTNSGQPGNVELIYAGLVGLGIGGNDPYAGHLFKAQVSDGTLTSSGWTDLWPSPVTTGMLGFNPQQFTISSVTTDPHDATGGTVYVTLDGFSTGQYPTALVYSSTNAGAGWTNITSNLPYVPANSIAIDPNDANTVYVGLDTGVYVTTAVTTCSIQNCWGVYGTGLPNSPVLQLASFQAGGQSMLRAGTYGRGIWQIPLETAAVPIATATTTPTALTFPPQAVQTQSAALTVTISNSGTVPVTVSGVTTNDDFAAVNNCGDALEAGGACTIQVTFTPTTIGQHSGRLTIYANVAGGQMQVPLSGSGIAGGAIVLLPTSMTFGISAIGVATSPPQNVTISNTGGATVALQVPTVTGDFAIAANTCSTTLAPNFGCTVSIAFTPTASGARTGLFSISDDAGTQTATLSGTGFSPATDVVAPAALSFAAQVIGTASAARSVTLTNSGDSPLNSIGIAITGDFKAVDGCGETLIGHASCSIAVTYVPTTVGAASGALTINDMYGRPQIVTLTGSGVAPAGISVLPASIDYGSWGVGSTSAAQSIVVTNRGGTPLDGLKFSITGEFLIASNSCGQTLASGANCSIQTVFAPLQPGPQTGSLSVTSSSLANSFQIALAGSGLSFSFQASGASSQTITGGQTASYMLQITPSTGSSGMLTLACAAAPPNSTCTMNPSSIEIRSEVSASVAVAIGTTADDAALHDLPGESKLRKAQILWSAVFLPFGFISRRRRLTVAASFLLLLLPLGCGVSASGGSSSASSSEPGATPSATYTPVITASGPGIAKTVKLTLVVE